MSIQVLSWLLKFEKVCCDLTIDGSLFDSTGIGMAKPYLPMAFLGQVEETVPYWREYTKQNNDISSIEYTKKCIHTQNLIIFTDTKRILICFLFLKNGGKIIFKMADIFYFRMGSKLLSSSLSIKEPTNKI